MKNVYEFFISRMFGLYVRFHEIIRSEKGQTLVEYGLLLVLIAVVVIAAVTMVGQTLNSTYNNVAVKLP